MGNPEHVELFGVRGGVQRRGEGNQGNYYLRDAIIKHIALQNNVKIHSFSRYFLGRQTRAGLIFGYGSVDLPEMNRGLSALRNALQ